MRLFKTHLEMYAELLWPEPKNNRELVLKRRTIQRGRDEEGPDTGLVGGTNQQGQNILAKAPTKGRNRA